MKVLVIYASVEGQTAKIAGFVADEISGMGHEVGLVNADDSVEISLDGVEAVVLAGSVHQRRHTRNFEAMLSAQAADLKEIRTLLLSVSLNAAFPEGFDEAQEYVDEMLMRTGLAPDKTILVGGALRTAKYDYFAMQVVRHVVMRNRPFDPAQTVHEFTDWDAVANEVRAFLGQQ